MILIRRFIIVILFLGIINVKAQTEAEDSVKTPPLCRHEFSVWGAGGVSALNYNPTFGDRAGKAGGMFGMGYTVYAAKWLGISIGAEVGLYRTAYRLKNLKDSYTRYGFDDLTPDWTGANEKIDYHAELQTYGENQQLYTLNIPLALQFEIPLGESGHRFYISAGAKLGIPLKSTFQVSDATLYTWYYDYKSNQEFRPDPTDYGTPYLEDLGCFYNQPYSTGKQSVKFKPAGLLSFELGAKWRLNSKLSLYSGAYLDYGFNAAVKQGGDRFFEFNPEQGEMSSNSILTSQYTHNRGLTRDFAEKVSPLSFGVKLRLGVNLCKSANVDKSEKSKKSKKSDRDNETETRISELNDRMKSIEELLTKTLGKGKSNRLTGDDSDMEVIRANFNADLLFETGSSKLQPRFKQMLTPLVQILHENPATTIDIIGHTDNVGSLEFNQRLSSQRAQEVADYLIYMGAKPNQIKRVVGRNYSEPTATNATPEGRRQNRRVEVLMYVAP